MTTDETARLHLYEQARATWDDEAARTLMTALPWDVADLATKADVLAVKDDVLATKDELRNELAMVEARLESKIDRASSETLRTMVFSMVMTNVTIAGVITVGLQLAS